MIILNNDLILTKTILPLFLEGIEQVKYGKDEKIVQATREFIIDACERDDRLTKEIHEKINLAFAPVIHLYIDEDLPMDEIRFDLISTFEDEHKPKTNQKIKARILFDKHFKNFKFIWGCM